MSEISSTGTLGLANRSDDRTYYNFEYAVDVNNLPSYSGELSTHLNRVSSTSVTRSVMRAIMSQAAFVELVEDKEFHDSLEVAVPLESSATGQSISQMLVYFSRNSPERVVQSSERNDLLERRDEARRQPLTIPTQSQKGKFRFKEKVSDPVQLAELWGETFNWDIEGCTSFAATIDDQIQREPTSRNKWFKSLENNDGEVLSVAMCERLDMPTLGGNIALIEHTEWATKPEYRHHKLGGLVVTSLIENVEQDMDGQPNLIFAECNMTSGAYKVATRSGFNVPEVWTPYGEVPQILFKNVHVGDNLPPYNDFRSFLFAIVK